MRIELLPEIDLLSYSIEVIAVPPRNHLAVLQSLVGLVQCQTLQPYYVISSLSDISRKYVIKGLLT